MSKIEDDLNNKIINEVSEKTYKLLNNCDSLKYYKKYLKLQSKYIIDTLRNSNDKLKKCFVPVEVSINPLKDTIRQLESTIKPLLKLTYSYTPYFKELSDKIEKAKNDPDSTLNWIQYIDKMSDYFWILPYKIDSDKLKEILETVNSEKEFDKYITKYFNKKLVLELENDIYENLPYKHKVLFKQIMYAYCQNSYALVNTGIMSIIDGLCSDYISNKRCLKRVGIFEPIIKDLSGKMGVEKIIFILIMLENNIKILYEPINFNKKISISTNKKVRRHPNQHGQAYSNKKMDTIMLLNTLYYLVITKAELKDYRKKLYYDKEKGFYIQNLEEKTDKRI